jgi:chromosome segregation ATPase
MLQKTKVILIALAAFLVISVFVNLQTMRSQKITADELNSAKKENAALNKQVDDLSQKISGLEQKNRSLGSEVDRVSKEKEAINKRYEVLIQEKEDLTKRLAKAAAEKTEVKKQEAPQQSPIGGTAGDSYWAGILKAKAALELQMDTVRIELKKVQISNEQLLREKNNMNFDIKDLERKNQELKQQLDYNQKITDSLTQEMVREKNEKMVIENVTKVIKNENLTLRRQLKALTDHKISLERKVAEVQEKSVLLQDNYNRLENTVKDKLNQIDEVKEQLGIGDQSPGGIAIPKSVPEAKESVELPPIIVRPQSALEPMPSRDVVSQKGEVLLVNRENNFVIVNLGEDSGIKVGDILTVYRQDSAVAVLEAIQIRKNFSACDIKQESSPVKVGDRVK